jgi:hypothetical protein
MCVLVEDVAELITSMDIQPVESARFDDRRGTGRRCACRKCHPARSVPWGRFVGSLGVVTLADHVGVVAREAVGAG